MSTTEPQAGIVSSAPSPATTVLAALLSILLVVVQAFVNAGVGLTRVGVLQLAIVAAGAIATYLVPLVPGKWAGALKTGTAVVAAVLTAVIPLVVQGGHLTTLQIAVVVLAGLQVLGTEVGVYVRTKADVALAA